jgi:hypothetical protein
VHDIHVAIPECLADDARRAAQLPARTSVQALIRVALAKLAGWPDSAVRPAAEGRRVMGGVLADLIELRPAGTVAA